MSLPQFYIGTSILCSNDILGLISDIHLLSKTEIYLKEPRYKDLDMAIFQIASPLVLSLY